MGKFRPCLRCGKSTHKTHLVSGYCSVCSRNYRLRRINYGKLSRRVLGFYNP